MAGKAGQKKPTPVTLLGIVLLALHCLTAGTVTAASDWDQPPHRRSVRPSLEGSVERLLHESGIQEAALDLRDGLLGDRLLQRMIGVVYRPRTERSSHYVQAIPGRQFDLLVHVDETQALRPLEPWIPGEPPAETYPFGV